MKNSKLVKDEILEKVKEYYFLKQQESNKEFIPNETRINYAGRVYDDKELISLVSSSLDFWLTSGEYTKEFEKKLSEFNGTNHSLFVNSGSSANLLAISALTSNKLKGYRLKKGDEVITLACGFPTTVNPIIQCGAIPVFCDVEIDTLNIKVEDLETALSPKTKAIFIAATLGNSFNVNVIKDFCKWNKIWLIVDCCDALGTKYGIRDLATYADITTYSFYPPHIITTGEGGACSTNHLTLYKIMKSMRDWGRDCICDSGEDNKCNNRFNMKFKNLPDGYDHKYVYSEFGYNLKATDMQAAIGVEQLNKVNSFIKKRKENFEYYYNKFKQLEDFFILPKQEKYSDPTWFGFYLTLKDNVHFTRKDLIEYLESKNIQTRLLFAGNIIKQPCFENMIESIDYRVSNNLNNTNKIMNDTFWLGVYPNITKEQIDFIFDSVYDFCKKE